jgi:asparagine synthase (glutamine-hydrolysing)
MSSLLERKDRMSMASGLEVRVPFADHRILEFVYNVPWEIKFENGVEKALLRNALKEHLPEKILWRKKSPYPKTHNPKYREAVTEMLKTRLEKKGRLSEIIDKDVLNSVLSGEDKTWFGQLMSTPQLIAWLIQFDYWLENYNIEWSL